MQTIDLKKEENVMNKKIIIAFLLVLPLLLGSIYISRGETEVQAQEPNVTTITYEFDENAPQLPRSPGALPWTDIAVHGTNWVAETRYQLSMFKPWGWGTAAKAKAAGDQWVHISVPYITYLEDKAQMIRYVEFCAKSTNGAASKPTDFHLWAHNTRFYTGTITWPANNNINCHGVTFNPGVWKQDLGISVRLHFANNSDAITLYKAWVQTEE
jgi:hypothetical protein